MVSAESRSEWEVIAFTKEIGGIVKGKELGIYTKDVHYMLFHPGG